MTGQAIAIQGNARQLPLPDESVDLIVTSPPYFALRSYRDDGEHYTGQIGSEPTPQEFLEALWECTAEMARVLKPTGSIFVNLGDKYAGSGGHNNSGLAPPRTGEFATRKHNQEAPRLRASRRTAPDRYNQESGGVHPKSLMLLPHRYAIGCEDRLGLIVRQDQVWSKPNGLPESVTDRTRRSHEYWFHLVKSPRYFAAVDEIRESYADSPGNRYPRRAILSDQTRRDGGTPGLKGTTNAITKDYQADLTLGKLPGSVWTIPSEPLVVPQWARDKYDLPDHFAAFPQEWPRRLILGWSPTGICVECGEGRRPVVDKSLEVTGGWSLENDRYVGEKDARQHNWKGAKNVNGHTEAAITGYACACPEPTAEASPSVILDPFGGTGTVALVARALGRVGISVDLSHDYSELARWRIFESKHGAKAMARTNAERQGTIL